MGYLILRKTSKAISDLFDEFKILTCNQIKDYIIKNKCCEEIILPNGKYRFDDDESVVIQKIDHVIFMLYQHESGEMRLYPDPIIEHQILNKKQQRALKNFWDENPDWEILYNIHWRKTKNWQNRKIPIYDGVSL